MLVISTFLLLALLVGAARSTLAQDAGSGQQPDLTATPTQAAIHLPIIGRPPLTPKDPKPATTFTKAANAAMAAELPFGDTQAYTDVQYNLIAPLPAQVVTTTAEAGIAWDPYRYSFIPLNAPTPDTVNPSLWRQSQLVNFAASSR
jgi:alkyl sulfatase BDS1-like metallo-beta-lactamase superfamily hydrolase